MTPPRNCRKTLVGASIARPCPFALQENRPGKCVAAASWRATNGRPYTRNKAGMQFFDGLRSGQDRSLQISRQRCGGYNKVGGNKKSHHGRWWDLMKLEINLAAMPRGFESHRLRQKQHPAGRCFLFLRQTMQGLQGEIRTACARRFASRRAKMPRWGIFRARESPRVCAKSSTLRGAAYYFCGKLCKGCKVGFEQPVPGALRPAGLQQSCGLLQGRGRIPPPAPSITTQFHIG